MITENTQGSTEVQIPTPRFGQQQAIFPPVPEMVLHVVAIEKFFADYITALSMLATNEPARSDADARSQRPEPLFECISILRVMRDWFHRELESTIPLLSTTADAFFADQAPPFMLPMSAVDNRPAGEESVAGRMNLGQYLTRRSMSAIVDSSVNWLFSNNLGKLFDVVVFKDDPKVHYVEFPAPRDFLHFVMDQNASVGVPFQATSMRQQTFGMGMGQRSGMSSRF